MQKLLAIVVFTCFFSHKDLAQNYNWMSQSSGTTSTLHEPFFLNNFEAFVGGWNGTLLKTTNGGMNWYSLPSPTVANLSGIYFENNQHGFITDIDNKLWETTDGGINWTLNFYSPVQDFSELDYNNGRIFAMRENDFLISDDNGASWDSIPAQGGPTSADFMNATKGFYVTISGTIYETNNNGDSWTQITGVSNPTVLWDIECATSSNVFAVGGSGSFLASSDAGNTWFTISSGTSETLWDVSFANGTHGLVTGNNNYILETTDGGLVNWSPAPTAEVGVDSYAVFAATSTIAYVFYTNGAIYRAPAGVEDIEMLNYLGPDTVCVGTPFDLSWEFSNVGGGPSFNPGFTIVEFGQGSIFGDTISYIGTVDTGDVVVHTEPGAILNNPGSVTVVIFSVEQNSQGNNTLVVPIEVVLPSPTDVTGGTFFCPGDTVILEASGGIDYYWQSGVSSDFLNPTQTVYPDQTQIYVVEIEQEYCKVLDTAYVFLDPNCNQNDTIIGAPSEVYAFSPNFDGVNDHLVLDFIDPDEGINTVTIYNRWGDVVYETRNYDNAENSWDGTFGSRYSSSGTYFLIAETTNIGVVKAWVQIVK